MFCSFFAAVGLLVTLNWLFVTLRSPCLLIWGSLKQAFGSRPFTERYGKWAVITGSSDGIGRGYAQVLARRGMNVMLLSRTESKLQQVADDIRSRYAVEARYVVVDFAKGEQIYETLENVLKPLDIGILVNNVGVGTDYPEYVHAMPHKTLWNMVNVNVGAATALCRMLVPGMVQRRRGLIINISSILSYTPSPLGAIYAASKAYMSSFSSALQHEVEPLGIEVQTVCPGVVHTNMTNTMLTLLQDRTFNATKLDIDSYIQFAECTIGKTDATTGHWLHGIQVTCLQLLPTFIKVKLAFHLARGTHNKVTRKLSKRN